MRNKRRESQNQPSRCSSTLSSTFMSLGSFLSEQEKGNGDINKELFLKFMICLERVLGMCVYLTVTNWAALALRLNGFGTGQDRTDDWITDHGSLLQRNTRREESFISHTVFKPYMHCQRPILFPFLAKTLKSSLCFSLPGSCRRSTYRNLESSGSREHDTGSQRSR